MDAAANDRRVETLVLARLDRCWAPHDHGQAMTIHAQRAPGGLDLLDELARRVVDTGGDVVVLDDKGAPGTIAAIVR